MTKLAFMHARAGIAPGLPTNDDGGRSNTMAAIPEKYLDLLQQKKAFANLATLMPDGSPQVTPVWFDYKDGVIRVNTAKGRVKARNMKEGAPVALAVMDPDNPYRYVQVRGRVKRVAEQNADAHIDTLAKKYLGKDKYPWARPGDVRVIYEIEPTSASGMS
jgi:PPOX class probable F420-dependent enzyme